MVHNTERTIIVETFFLSLVSEMTQIGLNEQTKMPPLGQSRIQAQLDPATPRTPSPRHRLSLLRSEGEGWRADPLSKPGREESPPSQKFQRVRTAHPESGSPGNTPAEEQ